MGLPATAPRRRHRPAAERARLEQREAHLQLVPPPWQVREWSPYPCMTDDEWAAYTATRPEPVEHPDLTREACRDCPLEYQVAMEAANRCWPADYSLTPKGRQRRRASA